MNKNSPLLDPVVNRSGPNLDDFTEDVDAEIVGENATESASPHGGGTGPNLDDFKEGSPETPYHEEIDEDSYDHATDAEKQSEVEKNQKMLIKELLGAMDWAIPEGAHYISKFDVAQIKKWRAENPKTFVRDANHLEKRNEDNKSFFTMVTHKYTTAIENPLRQIVKDRALEISPEAQLAFYTLVFLVVMGYWCYTIRQDNLKVMAEFEKYHKEAERRTEEILKAEAEKSQAQEVQAEEVHDK